MEVKMNKIENNVVELEVKVESKKFDAALNKAYKKNVNKFNVQGFRKGKVPMAIVKKFYGVEVLFDDAINFCIDEAYPVALNENNVKPVDYPQIDVIEVGEGKDLVFKAKVTTYPEVKLGEYKGVEVSYTKPEVTDEQIENQLKDIQAKNARIETKTEGKVEDKNIAVIDFKGFIDGTPFEGGEGHDYNLEIGSGSFIGDFEQQLIGLEKGQSKDVNVTFPENYGREELNGKEAKFEVTVKDIKVKELPALDDEFAKEVSEFDTIAEYKADLKVKAEKANEERATRELQEKVIGQVVDNATIDLPQVMVDREVQNMIKDLEQRLSYQGLKLEQYLQMVGKTEEDMRKEFEDQAKKSVKSRLVLEAVVKAEKLEASEEEVGEKIKEMAKQYNRPEDELLANEQLRSYIAESMKTEKAIEFIVKNAKIK